MKVNIKKLHSDAIIPKYANINDAGLDLVATSTSISKEGFIEYGTGLSIEIPEGYVGLLYPRSSISTKYMSMCNSVGVIDSGYRGEIKVRFYDFELEVDDKGQMFGGEKCYEVGNKIAQLIIMPYPKIEFKEITELSETERGTGGFGSTDK